MKVQICQKQNKSDQKNVDFTITKMLSTKNRDSSIVHCSMLCDVLPINQRVVQSVSTKTGKFLMVYRDTLISHVSSNQVTSEVFM